VPSRKRFPRCTSMPSAQRRYDKTPRDLQSGLPLDVVSGEDVSRTFLDTKLYATFIMHLRVSLW
jgi:hypothetical protein